MICVVDTTILIASLFYEFKQLRVFYHQNTTRCSKEKP